VRKGVLRGEIPLRETERSEREVERGREREKERERKGERVRKREG